MALPAGMVTVQVNFGPFIDESGAPYEGAVTVSSSGTKVWAATGTPIVPRPVKTPLDANGSGFVRLPAVDQPGFVDGLGRAITNWTYSAQIELVGGPKFPRRSFLLQANGFDNQVVDLDSLAPIATTDGQTVEIDLAQTVGPAVISYMNDNWAEVMAPHVNDPEPHPAYDDIPSLSLYFENRIA